MRPRAATSVNYDDIEPWTRVSPRGLRAETARDGHARARRQGARVVLLDNELWPESPYRPVLATIARDERIPLVDSLRIIADERTTDRAGDMETRFHLEPATGTPSRRHPRTRAELTPVVFRVYEGAYPVPQQLSIVGNHPSLGNFVPNTIADARRWTDGDEQGRRPRVELSGDAAAGARLRYVYTNSGRRTVGRPGRAACPRSRRCRPRPDGRPVYLPVESFGRIYMQADNWHTDAVGYDLIARAVAAELR